jgi:hypothetical protein
MRRYFLTSIGVLGLQIIYCQNKTRLIEYLKSYEPSVSMHVNIFIPSFQKITNDTPQIVIRRKNDVWIYVDYRYRTKANDLTDTCFISTFTESHRKYYESAGMTASQLRQTHEGPCYDYSCGFCNFIISTTEIHYVSFRSGQKTKTYKLIVTD